MTFLYRQISQNVFSLWQIKLYHVFTIYLVYHCAKFGFCTTLSYISITQSMLMHAHVAHSVMLDHVHIQVLIMFQIRCFKISDEMSKNGEIYLDFAVILCIDGTSVTKLYFQSKKLPYPNILSAKSLIVTEVLSHCNLDHTMFAHLLWYISPKLINIINYVY